MNPSGHAFIMGFALLFQTPLHILFGGWEIASLSGFIVVLIPIRNNGFWEFCNYQKEGKEFHNYSSHALYTAHNYLFT